jgi:hypothetical protein
LLLAELGLKGSDYSDCFHKFQKKRANRLLARFVNRF